MLKPPSISEEELIQECKNGNLKQQERLYKHFFGFAMGVGMRYLSDREDTLEVINDAFIKVFRSIGNINNVQSFKPWLKRIVVNTALDRIRKDTKYMHQSELDEASEIGYEAQVLENMNARDILSLMNKLSYIQRTVFNMYEIDGYSHEEIGEILQIPAGTSRVNLSRAKDKLREACRLESMV
ncbi:RNA polymerase sigma factor [Daejeonella sp. H1SJ63]|jgi:RNA polymerase sigma-70 factor (ECF subfamily)|uniref:RNA polymerase sigma factor n=1 Tax=Daejeonella sp. H1SJ63 TaxID=3034145 RepID=UPI0023ECB1AC|nr:RNA polymerase sigma factor [Daejeonella sp. H1SJ63]